MKIFLPKKIAIHAPLHLGDTVMSLPLVENIKTQIPKVRLIVITTKELFPLWRGQPGVDRVLKWDPPCNLQDGFDLELHRLLTKEALDLSIILPTGKGIARTHAKAQIPVRIGYNFWKRKKFLTHFISTGGVPNGPEMVCRHMTQNYLNLLRLASLKPKNISPKLSLSSENRGQALRQLRLLGLNPKKGIVGIAPGAQYGPSKRWPLDSYMDLSDLIFKEMNLKVLWLGSKEDRLLLTTASQGINLMHGANCIGKTTISELMGYVAQCRLVVSNDSGISHVAGALGVPTVTLFGSSSPIWTRPQGPWASVLKKNIDCSPCFEPICPLGHMHCLRQLSVDRVFRAIMQLMSKTEHPTIG